MARRNIRIAVIGCGAVTQKSLLPVLAKQEDLQVALLVDKDRSRMQALASQYNISDISEDYQQAWKKADAAIVALPHNLHAPVSVDLLNHGIHVFVEKPMALTTVECTAMNDAAREKQVVLSVGLMRRFLWSAILTKNILDSEVLGTIHSFDIREGFVYNWPVASDFFFRKQTAGGGVLIDTGAHTVDMMLWWLGDVASFEYFDDSFGGVEADCALHLIMNSGASGYMELSRTRTLRNTCVIHGSKASLEVQLHGNKLKLIPKGSGEKFLGNAFLNADHLLESQSGLDWITAEIEDWATAIREERAPILSGTEGSRSIAFIEKCYANRRSLHLPWMYANINKIDIKAGVS